MKKSKVQSIEFDPYYGRYISMLSDTITLQSGFMEGKTKLIDFFSSLPENLWDYSYEVGKWTIKEILQHLIDVERIFMYRCFRIARRDLTNLSSFDQAIYIPRSRASEKSMKRLLFEFEANRNNSICLLNSLSVEDLCFSGKVNATAMSARAAAFIIIGHDLWHMEAIKTKYL